jgi:pimeloyl-ACP methyl ester carboxylesterase
MRAVTPRPAVWFALALLMLGCAARVAAQPEPAKVLLRTADSVQVAAFWYGSAEPKGAPVALLLHDPGQTHQAWRPLIAPLYRSGFRILSLDFRGHGESKEITPEIYDRMRQHETQPYFDMIRDIEAAVRWLGAEQKVPTARIALVGGGFSANLAIQAVARNRNLGATVALSPAKTYFQSPLIDWARKYGNKPLFIIVPKQLLGEGSSEIAQIMAHNPGFEMKVYPRSDIAGVQMLGVTPDLENLITRWLCKVFGLKAS